LRFRVPNRGGRRAAGGTTVPHILIMGPGLPPDDLRRRLAGWGLTSAQGAEAAHGRLPTVADCDAVLWFGAPPAPPAPAGAEVPAPVLLVGEDDPHGAAWQTIPPRKAGGDCLRRALEGCFAQARRLRERGVDDPLRTSYRDFLGHELRSPLTAIRTALEEIAAVPGDPGPLPDIALRNVARLHQVLEWSQDLLALAEAPRDVIDAMLDGLVTAAPWAASPDAGDPDAESARAAVPVPVA